MEKVMNRILEFRKERDWEQFHTDTNLAKSICLEASEVLELVQWNPNANLDKLKEEVADVFTYTLFLIHDYGFSTKQILVDKIEKNSKKYNKVKEVVLEDDSLKSHVKRYVLERNWELTDSTESIAISLVVEAGELLRNYEWNKANFNIENVKDEIADILTLLISLCITNDWDIEEIILEKMEKNAKKYPVEKSYGRSNKYTEL